MITGAPQMVTTTCSSLDCGIPFAVPTHVYNQTQRVGQERKVYCPNGHVVIWTRTNEERLRERVAELESSLATARNGRDAAYRSVAYWKGIATRWKARARR